MDLFDKAPFFFLLLLLIFIIITDVKIEFKVITFLFFMQLKNH
jgi:hypothetical protein